MLPSVSSKLLRSRPSNELCFLVLSLPTLMASGVRYHARSDFSPHWTSSVSMAASFRASTLCPDARARPRFSAFVHPVRHLRPVFSHPPRRDLLGSPAASSEPRNPAKPRGHPLRCTLLSQPSRQGASPRYAAWPCLPAALFTGSTLRLTAQFFALWPTAPSLAGTHCHSATSPVELRRGLDFNQLEAGITPRHVATAEGRGF